VTDRSRPRTGSAAPSRGPNSEYLQKSDSFQQNNAPNTTLVKMAVSMMRTAGRTVLRRPYLHIRQQPLAKRHNTTSSTPTTARPKQDDPANSISIPVPNTVGAIPIWQRLGPLSRGFQAYGKSQRKRPLATQFVSSLVIFFLGDISAQSISGDDYDYKRTLRALVISAGSSIPNYKWYGHRKFHSS